MCTYDVCVLMSTYNGERYLQKQIESILCQSSVKVTVIVRDDGSSDRTLEILDSYESYGKLVVIEKNSHENYGPAKSFMKLIYLAGTYDFYAFADQDDIWKPEKLFVAVKKLVNSFPEQPALYCSNQLIYENEKEIGYRYSEPPMHTLISTICGNNIAGCTMVFNKYLREILLYSRQMNEYILSIRMHDTWVMLVALCLGNVIYDHDAYIDYRIHANNAVGLGKRRTIKLKKILKRFIQKENLNGRSLIAEELLKIYGTSNLFKLDDIEVLRKFAQVHNGFAEKYTLIQDKRIRKECKDQRLVFIIKVLLDWI